MCVFGGGLQLHGLCNVWTLSWDPMRGDPAALSQPMGSTLFLALFLGGGGGLVKLPSVGFCSLVVPLPSGANI